MRLVIDQIRGKKAVEAIGILHFSPNRASRDAEAVLRSAVANLQNKFEDSFDPETVFVKEAFVNQGATMKRIRPSMQGRAYRIRKRSNHLTIIVAQK
jgi:large subunit ribosomal protein L22